MIHPEWAIKGRTNRMYTQSCAVIPLIALTFVTPAREAAFIGYFRYFRRLPASTVLLHCRRYYYVLVEAAGYRK
jgi:hypothetical protein